VDYGQIIKLNEVKAVNLFDLEENTSYQVRAIIVEKGNTIFDIDAPTLTFKTKRCDSKGIFN
jgi:hypothetical protein